MLPSCVTVDHYFCIVALVAYLIQGAERAIHAASNGLKCKSKLIVQKQLLYLDLCIHWAPVGEYLISFHNIYIYKIGNIIHPGI